MNNTHRYCSCVMGKPYVCSLLISWILHASHLKILTTRHTTCCGYVFSRRFSTSLHVKWTSFSVHTECLGFSSECNTSASAFAIAAILSSWRIAIIRGSFTAIDPLQLSDVARKIEMVVTTQLGKHGACWWRKRLGIGNAQMWNELRRMEWQTTPRQ